MNDIRWIRVARCEWIPSREGRAVRIGDQELAVFNLGDGFLATDNECPHKGGPLCDGIVTGRADVCPLHGWKINLESGVIERPGGAGQHGVRTYPVRIVEGVVAVGIPGGDPDDSVDTGTLHNCHQIQA